MLMQKIVVIQDVRTKEYFWTHRVDQGFTSEFNDANRFRTIGEAMETINEEYLESVFRGRILELLELSLVEVPG